MHHLLILDYKHYAALINVVVELIIHKNHNTLIFALVLKFFCNVSKQQGHVYIFWNHNLWIQIIFGLIMLELNSEVDAFLIEKLFIAWIFIVYLTVLNGNVSLLIVYRYNKCSQPTNSLNWKVINQDMNSSLIIHSSNNWKTI